MKKTKHSLWLHYGLSATIVIGTLLTVAWYSTDKFHDFFIHHLRDSLEARAITVKQAAQSIGINKTTCNVLEKSDPTVRVTIINTQGRVLCDSEADPTSMENHASRPEIKQALNGGRGSITRFSNTLQMTMLYLTIPNYQTDSDEDKITGVIRTAMPLVSIENLLKELYEQFLLIFIALLVIIAIVIYNTYRKINQPLALVVEEANQFAKGNFDTTQHDFEVQEIDELSNAMNRMATQLDRLENLRQDFVANVSHELITPIATIKSYVETLLDGAQHNKEDLERFLIIVLKQNDRLNAIVDDLLTLSRLESAPLTQLLQLNDYDSCDLLASAIDSCQSRAENKKIKIKLNCNQTILIHIDESLMTQALINLLDNAIKYSNENTTITLSASSNSHNNKVIISVSDQGPGIPEQHIPRLFERFYRVDKSRSRNIGGTGLGLAIVKHIVHIHGGEISVVNNGGAGSCFSITLSSLTS